MLFCFFHDFSCFFDLAFCHPFLGVIFLDFGGFGRFRGPPKSTLDLQNDTFYDGASTILKKHFFFNKKKRCATKHVFLSLLYLQKPPKIRPWIPKVRPRCPQGPSDPAQATKTTPLASILEAPGLRFGGSGPPFGLFTNENVCVLLRSGCVLCALCSVFKTSEPPEVAALYDMSYSYMICHIAI